MRTYIIVANTKDVDRRKLERIEGCGFQSVQHIHLEVGANALVLSLSDFMDAVNDEDLQDFKNKWIGYAHVK